MSDTNKSRGDAEDSRGGDTADDAQQRLANIIEFLPDATFVIDGDKRVVAWNHACELLTGVKKDQLLGKGDFAYAEPFYGERRPILIDLAGAPSHELETIYDHVEHKGDVIFAEGFVPGLRDGQGAYLRGEASVLFDRQGSPCGAIEVIHDVTDQKRTEQALRKSEREYRELVMLANSIILRWSRDGRVTFLNEFGQHFFGYTQEEIVGRHVVGTIVPASDSSGVDLPLLMDAICADPEKFERNINENMRRNGDRVWIDWTNKVVLDDQGKPKEVLSIGSDVTERRKNLEDLRKSNRALRTLSECNQALVHAADETTLLNAICRIVVNIGGYRLAWVGYPEEDDDKTVRPVAQAGFEDGYLDELHISWGDTERGRGPTGTAIRARQPIFARDILTDPTFEPWRAEATKRGYASSAVLPLVADGVILGALNIYAAEPDAFDATEVELLKELAGDLAFGIVGHRTRVERTQAEAKVIELNQVLRDHLVEVERQVTKRTAQLAARNQELKDFAYTVSHDLKAPLRGISGYANELNRKHRAGLGERALFCLSQILTATSHLDKLIEDLLHYSRLDAETPSHTDVNLRDVVAAILHDRELVISEQKLDVSVEIPFETMHAWERGLMQVLTNLIDNAIKYSRKTSAPRLRIDAEEIGQGWRIVVTDNGVGFDMKYHDRIFGLFNRLVRMEEYEGTGAGLAIVKKVIDKQGGRIWAESAPGQGAKFFVELPRPSDKERGEDRISP
jgi:PAS domain S-box-containing protein